MGLTVLSQKSRHALLAQLVEQLTLNQRAQGSSPWKCTRKKRAPNGARFFVALPPAGRLRRSRLYISAQLAGTQRRNEHDAPWPGEPRKVNKAQQGTHIYTYDELNRMVTSDVSKVFTNYTYDTLGNLVLETAKNKSVDYEYNELNQLVKRTTTENETFTYSYDKRGNRVAETGKKESREYVYDATNRLVEGTNWKGDKSAYTYNGLGLRVNNLVTTHAGKTYDRDYVIDYTSPENDDLYVYAMGNGQLEYEQRHVYAGSERLEQITEKGTGGWERTLYVHEDVMGNTRYYTKATGQNFAELQYDAWGQPVSPNKLVNNDHGNYVFATFTGHIYDTTLDVYFAEARFYDATTRTWMAMDPIKSGLNWYQYCGSNPTTYWDPTGLLFMMISDDLLKNYAAPLDGSVVSNVLDQEALPYLIDLHGQLNNDYSEEDPNRARVFFGDLSALGFWEGIDLLSLSLGVADARIALANQGETYFGFELLTFDVGAGLSTNHTGAGVEFSIITFKYGWINNRTDRSINFNLGSIGAHLELSKSGKNKVGISYGGGIAYESAPVTIKS